MIFCIINAQSQEIMCRYDAEATNEETWQTDYRPPFAFHVELPAGIDPECAQLISWQETVTVTDAPERIDEETGETIPAVTHEEQVTRYGFEFSTTLAEQKAERQRKEKRHEKVRNFRVRCEEGFADEIGELGSEAILVMLLLNDMQENPADYLDAKDAAMDTEAKVKAYAKEELKPIRKVAKKQIKAFRKLREDLSQI